MEEHQILSHRLINLTQDHIWGYKFHNAYTRQTVCIRFQPNLFFMRTLVTTTEHRVIFYMTISHVLKENIAF